MARKTRVAAPQPSSAASPQTAPPVSPPAGKPEDPALQGEGNHSAARRHRKSVEQFIASGQVEPAARKAQPDDASEARAMQDAEKSGRARARR